MVGWYHQLNEHEFEQTLGDSEGQGSLACCSPWGHKELDMTYRLNNNGTQGRPPRDQRLFLQAGKGRSGKASVLGRAAQAPARFQCPLF